MAAGSYCSVFFLIILVSLCKESLSQNKSTKVLRDYLFSDYSSDVRPVYNNSQTTKVIMRMNLRNLLRMDTVEQVFTATSWLKLAWTDEYLTWNPDDFFGIKRLNVPVDKVWTPDITLHDNADLAFERYRDNTYVQINFDGTMVWFVHLTFTTSCKVRVKWFPFDMQVCEVVFGSWSYDGFEIDLHQEKSLDASSNRYLANGVWDLYAVRVKRTVVTYLCCPEPYPELHYLVVLKRSAGFYMYYMVLPCMFLSVLSLLVFYLPPDCGEKLTLSITNLLALVVFQQVIAENMPPTSDDSPVIGTYFLCMIIMVCMSVIATGFVMHLSAIKHKMPHWVKRLFLNYIPRIMCMTIGPLEHNDSKFIANTSASCYRNGLDILKDEHLIETENTKPTQHITDNKSLKEAADSLKFLVKDLAAKNNESFEHLQWRRVSVVIDRLLLALFSTYIVLCTLNVTIIVIVGKDNEFDDVEDTLESWY